MLQHKHRPLFVGRKFKWVVLSKSQSSFSDVAFVDAAVAAVDSSDPFAWSSAIKQCAKSGERNQCLQLFQQMLQEGIMPGKLTFVAVVSACALYFNRSSGKQRNAHDGAVIGQQMHTRILATKYALDFVVNTALISMYGKLSKLESASKVFDGISSRDVVTWTTIVTVYSQQGRGLKALHLHYQMLQEGFLPDGISFISILDACTSAPERECRRIHVTVLYSTHEDNVTIGTALFNMYGKLGSLNVASDVFDRISARNVLTWTALIGIHVQNDKGQKAFQIFNDMCEQGILPNAVSFINILGAIINEGNICMGKQIHVCVLYGGFEVNVSLWNSLVNMYGKFGSFEDAWMLFEELPRKDLVSYTTIIQSSVSHGMNEKALGLLSLIVISDDVPDPTAFASIFEACANFPCCFHAKIIMVIHTFVVECGHETDVILSNILLNVYGRYQNFEEARGVFEKMPVRDKVAWNSIIGMHAQQGCIEETLQLFSRMHQEEIPDKITHLIVLSTIRKDSTFLHRGESIHVQVLHAHELNLDVNVGTALVSMHGRCGNLKYAERVFNELQNKDLLTWVALSTQYAERDEGRSAVHLFQRMLLECFLPDQGSLVHFISALSRQMFSSKGRQMHACILYSTFATDVIVNNALLSMYGKHSVIEDAEIMFNDMNTCDSVSWNILLSIYNLNSRNEEALQLADKALCRGFLPDIVSWTSCLTCCAEEMCLAIGKRIHSCVNICGILETDDIVTTALINMYGKCGDLWSAKKMFIDLQRPSLVCWNTVIAVHAQHGLGHESLELFSQMLFEGCEPDESTFASTLAACSHAGLLHEGFCSFSFLIRSRTSLSPIHFSCIIDLLSRIGKLDDAENLINVSPIEDITSLSLLTLLGSCRYQKDVARGERMSQRILELDPNLSASYVLLSNLYGHANYNATYFHHDS